MRRTARGLSVRLAAQVQARTQQLAAATGQGNFLLGVAHARNITAAPAEMQKLPDKRLPDNCLKQDRTFAPSRRIGMPDRLGRQPPKKA